MLKNFYIVKDQQDLLSGKIIPTKVLNQIPIGALYPMGPIIQPIPITKSRELVISPPISPYASPVFSRAISPTFSRAISPTFSRAISPTLSPFSPISVSRTIAPLAPVITSPSFPRVNLLNRYNQPYRPYVNPYGPPIIKLSQMAEKGETGKIEIKPDTGDSYLLDVPLKHFRAVVQFINDEIKANVIVPIKTTTIDALSNGQNLPRATINVVSTAGFPTSGTLLVQLAIGVQTVTYTGITNTSFIGCVGGTGLMATGNTVSLSTIQTAISVASNGQNLPQATINVASTTGFPSSGSLRIQLATGQQNITYTGVTATSFTGCSGGSGVMTTGNQVLLATGSKVLFKVILPDYDWPIETTTDKMREIVEKIKNKPEWKSVSYVRPDGTRSDLAVLLSYLMRRRGLY